MPADKKRLLIATFNSNKVKEIIEIAQQLKLNFEFFSLRNIPDVIEVVEDGSSFEENAVKKAVGYFRQSNFWTLAEDSGLSVKALNGLPGIHSARFAGDKKIDLKNNLRLLELMKDEQNREAKFICVSALALDEEKVITFRGELVGRIAYQLRGSSGFGYDPVFIPEGYNKTLAELGPQIKNQISHRRKAIQQALEYLRDREID